jgi:hypothetical protein
MLPTNKSRIGCNDYEALDCHRQSCQGWHTTLVKYEVEAIPTLEDAHDIARRFEGAQVLIIFPGPPFKIVAWCEQAD